MRAALGVVTAALLAGELAAACRAPEVILAAAALAGIGCCVRCPRALGWLLLAAGAFALGNLRMRALVAPALPSTHVARLELPLRTVLTGRVAVAPERRGRRVVLALEAEAVGRGPTRRAVSGLVRVSIRRSNRHWRYGDRLELPATLRRPRNFENPGRFDYVGHLARRGVHVTAFVWDGREVRLLPGRARSARARLERWRARVAAAIAADVPAPEGAVLRALVVGDEGGVDDALREAFTRAGVVHVLSISGLHIGLVAAAAFALVHWLLGRSERLLLRTDGARLAALLGLVPVAIYTALAGLGVATLRSAIMVAATVAAMLAGRRVDVLRALVLAALVLVLAWPGTTLDIAFQLSFASVLAIVCGTRRLAGPGTSRWRQAALVSPCALIGTAPLTAFHFHQVSLVGVLANPLTLPVFGSAVVVPGLAGALLEPVAPAAAGVAFRAAGLVLRPGIWLVRALARPDWAALDVPIPSLLELALLYGVLAAVVLLPRRAARVLLALACAGLLADVAWWVQTRVRPGTLRVTFLDVGQGDAVVAEFPGGRVLVVDAGGFPGGDFDTGAAIVSPFLLSRKIRRVDVLAMTHAHPDHSGGLPYLLAHHRPREFWWTGVPGAGAEWERLRSALGRTGTVVRDMAAGDALPAFVAGELLHPPAKAGPTSLNDSSLTLRLRLGSAGILLTGDIEAAAEARLLLAPERLRATVLKVPHHGSRTSSTPAFVAAVSPRVAVVSVGADNRYALPSREVEARYRAAGACLLRTDRCGAVTVETDGTRLRVTTVRPGCGCPAMPRA